MLIPNMYNISWVGGAAVVQLNYDIGTSLQSEKIGVLISSMLLQAVRRNQNLLSCNFLDCKYSSPYILLSPPGQKTMPSLVMIGMRNCSLCRVIVLLSVVGAGPAFLTSAFPHHVRIFHKWCYCSLLD